MKAELDKAWEVTCRLYVLEDKLWNQRCAGSTVHPAWDQLDLLWRVVYNGRVAEQRAWVLGVRRILGLSVSMEWVDEGCLVAGVMLFLYDEEI